MQYVSLWSETRRVEFVLSIEPDGGKLIEQRSVNARIQTAKGRASARAVYGPFIQFRIGKASATTLGANAAIC